MATRVLHVVTNVGHYGDDTHPTGLWLSELSHAWGPYPRFMDTGGRFMQPMPA